MPWRPHMQPPAFDPARPQLTRPVRIDPHGRRGPTTAQARGRQWRRTSKGFYVPAAVSADLVEQRIVEAAHHLSDHTAVTGWAALRWCGALWFDGYVGRRRAPVELTSVQRAVRPQDGVHVCGECIPPTFRTKLDGLNVIVPVSAVAFGMRYAFDLVSAVRVFDLAAAADLVSTAELLEHLELLYHWTGIPQARTAAQLVDENAWSPAEVDVRLVWPLELGLAPPLTNRPVFDLDGRHIGTPDLLDVEAGMAVDYDGQLHLVRAQRDKDVLREDEFQGVGLHRLTLVTGDLADRSRMAARIAAARSRAPFTPAERRRWTITPPPWWVPTHTVELRRRLTATQQERFLRYRRAS